MASTLLIAASQQFHFAFDSWKEFARQYLDSELGKSNWVLFDLNPDLVKIRRENTWALQESNSFHHETLSFVDVVVVAEPFRWQGPGIEVLYHLVRKYDVPLLLFFPWKKPGLKITPLEESVLTRKKTLVWSEVPLQLGAVSVEATQFPKYSFYPAEPLPKKWGVFFDEAPSRLRKQLIDYREVAKQRTCQIFCVTLNQYIYLKQILPKASLFYDDSVMSYWQELATCEGVFTQDPLLQSLMRAHEIPLVSDLKQPEPAVAPRLVSANPNFSTWLTHANTV